MALPLNAAPPPYPIRSLRQDVTLYSRHLGHVSLSVSVAARDLQGSGAAERAPVAAVAEAQQRAVAQQAAEQEKLRLQAEGEERARREAEQMARQDTEQRVAAAAAEAAAAEAAATTAARRRLRRDCSPSYRWSAQRRRASSPRASP